MLVLFYREIISCYRRCDCEISREIQCVSCAWRMYTTVASFRSYACVYSKLHERKINPPEQLLSQVKVNTVWLLILFSRCFRWRWWNAYNLERRISAKRKRASGYVRRKVTTAFDPRSVPRQVQFHEIPTLPVSSAFLKCQLKGSNSLYGRAIISVVAK